MIDEETYEKHLLEADERAVASFDQATLTLSGGGLLLSLTFLRNIATGQPLSFWALVSAWVAWFLSLAGVMLSFHTGHRAMRRYLGQPPDERRAEARRPGGRWSTVTEYINITAFVLFVLGAMFMAIFAASNL